MKKIIMITMMAVAPLMAEENKNYDEAFLVRAPQRSYVVDRHKDKVRSVSVVAWTDIGPDPTKHYLISEKISSCFIHPILDGDLMESKTVEAHYSLKEEEFVNTLKKVGTVSRVPGNLTTSQIFGLLGSAKAHAEVFK